LVLAIALAEPLCEAWLFQQRYRNEVDDEEESEPFKQPTRSCQHGLREQNKQDAADHGVADVSVHPLDNENPGRIPRGQRAPTHPGEMQIVDTNSVSPSRKAAALTAIVTTRRGLISKPDPCVGSLLRSQNGTMMVTVNGSRRIETIWRTAYSISH
jgi:hypothetical protein